MEFLIKPNSIPIERILTTRFDTPPPPPMTTTVKPVVKEEPKTEIKSNPPVVKVQENSTPQPHEKINEKSTEANSTVAQK